MKQAYSIVTANFHKISPERENLHIVYYEKCNTAELGGVWHEQKQLQFVFMDKQNSNFQIQLFTLKTKTYFFQTSQWNMAKSPLSIRYRTYKFSTLMNTKPLNKT